MFDFASLLAFFAPVAVEAGKAAVQRFLAPDSVKPTTIDDYIRMSEADTNRLKVVADLDRPGTNVPPWVNSIRALMRPAIALVVAARWVYDPVGSANVAAVVWSYLFGERTLLRGQSK